MIGMLKGATGMGGTDTAGVTPPAAAGAAQGSSDAVSSSSMQSSSGPVLSALLDTHLLADRHKAFEVFRKSYRQGQVSRHIWVADATLHDEQNPGFVGTP
jgi:kinesin family protein 6/9